MKLRSLVETDGVNRCLGFMNGVTTGDGSWHKTSLLPDRHQELQHNQKVWVRESVSENLFACASATAAIYLTRGLILDSAPRTSVV